MKKQILFFVMIATFVATNFAQDVKDESSKMDLFSSKTGVIIKFTDYKLPKLFLTQGMADTKIRKIESSDEVEYFFQISKKIQSDTKTAAIASEDLVDLINALETLKVSATNDMSTSEYIENKFITDDGFMLGYFISAGEVKWFLTLEKYGSVSTIFINNVSTIEKSFNGAKLKMDELMSK
jgi:hypothetical protein